MAADGLGASLAALAAAHPVVWLLLVVAVVSLVGIGMALGAWAVYGHASAELDAARAGQPPSRDGVDQ